MRALRKNTFDDASTAGSPLRSSKTDRRRFVCSSVASQCAVFFLFATAFTTGLYLRSGSSRALEAPVAVSFDAHGTLSGIQARWQGHSAKGSPDPRKQTAPSLAGFPWEQTLGISTTCTDTCIGHSSNGICEDGRGGDGRVYCDLGTDCADCGPWTHAMPSSLGEAQASLPVAHLLGLGVEVYVKRTRTVPSFLMPYTNPKQDVDVSGQMHINGNIELGLTQVWYTRLKGRCSEDEGISPGASPGQPAKGVERGRSGDTGKRLVVDIGANFGYYSLYAAAHGCRVIAWEPVPKFRSFLEYGVQLNGFQGVVHVRAAAVADKNGETYTLQVPQRGIWGTASIGGGNIDRSIDNEGAYDFIEVKGERVDSVVQEDVLMMKLDVEGFEPTAFQSSKGILDSYKVENVIMEYSPGVYDVGERWDEYLDWPRMLSYLLEHGFTLLHIRDELVGSSLLDENFQGALPGLEQILAENLLYDIDDAQKLQLRTLGCTPPTELSKRWPLHWGGCNFIPEDLHPKSFRGYFGHNTNVWAAGSLRGIQVTQPVGVQYLNQSATDWYGRDPRYGVGRRECEHIKPELQVRHRCRCQNQTICGEEAQMVENFALLGKLVPNAKPVGKELS
ncbi:g1700 [Coccomyxa elongata]